MRLVIEGSPADIRAAMTDTALIFNAVESKIKGEAAIDNMKRMKEKVSELRNKTEGALTDKENKELIDLRRESTEARQHIGAHKSALASAEAKIAQLKAEMANPIHLTSAQEVQLEAMFQSELLVMSEPPVFSNSEGHRITPSQILERVFAFLAKGDRMRAIKMIREVSGIKLNDGRDLVDNALRAFGCNIGHNQCPCPPRHEPIALPEMMPLRIEEKKI